MNNVISGARFQGSSSLNASLGSSGRTMNNKFRRGVYTRENGPEASALLDEEEYALDQIHPKKREDLSPGRRQPRDQTIECDIQPSDTLQTLSLKYNIPVAELKRVNNIFKEAEFFALKRIKIPVKPTSLLNDLLPGVHSEESKVSDGWYVDHRDLSNTMSSSMSSPVSSGFSSPCSEANDSGGARLHVKTLGIGDTAFSESKDKKKVKKFLKDMDKDLKRIREKQSSLNGDVAEAIDTTETRIYPLKSSSFQDDDAGGADMYFVFY